MDIDRQNKIVSSVVLFFQINEPQKAITLLENELVVEPLNGCYLYHLGCAYRRADRNTDALEALTKALGTDFEKDVVYYQLGLVFQCLNENSKAAHALRLSIDHNPNNLMAYNSLAIIYRKTGSLKLAIELYEKARSIAKSNASERSDGITNKSNLKKSLHYSALCCNEARTQLEIGNKDMAIALLKESIEHIPAGDSYEDPYLALEELGEY